MSRQHSACSMRTGWLASSRLIFAALYSLSTPLVCRASDKQDGARTWTLDNGTIRKVLRYTDQDGLSSAEWRDLKMGVTFFPTTSAHQPHHGFSVQADGVPISGEASNTRLTDAHQYTTTNGDIRLDLSFRSFHTAMDVVFHQELGRNEPAIRQWLTFTNRSGKAIVLRHLTIAEDALAPGPDADLIAFGGYGEEPRERFFTARVNDVVVLLENASTGAGFAVLSEVPGYLRRTELGRNDWTADFYAMYDTDLFPFERTLAPNESFDTAGVSVLLYRRNTEADPHWLIPEYVRDRISHNREQQSPVWIYNTWEPFHEHANFATVRELIPRIAAAGFSLLTVDEAWQERLGDNAVDLKKFPRGLEPVFSQADTYRLRHGLWCSVALIDQHASSYVQHPERACAGPDGKPRLSQGQGVVMSLGSAYKFALIDRVSQLVERFRLSYVKLDLTTVFNTYGEAPGCYEHRAEYKTPAESSVRIYEALALIADKLHQRFPDLIIDYTFELWGEKHLVDYGLLRVADVDWLSNVRDKLPGPAGPLAARTLLYARGMSIPVDTMLIGNLQAEISTWQERAATEMGSGPVLLGDLRKLTDGDAAHWRDWISRYTRLRGEVQITDSFFPLGNWQQPRSNNWDGFARFSRSGEGLIVLFRNNSGAANAKIAIPGFPDGMFALTSWNDRTKMSVAGSAVRGKLEIPFRAEDTATVLEIRRQHTESAH